MKTIRLFVIGEGIRLIKVGSGTTLADVASGENLTDHEFKVDEVDVLRTNWATTTLDNVQEIWASKGVKGA